MLFKNIDDYLNNHMINKIIVGQSGSDVYDVDNKYVLKHTVRNKLKNHELFLSYKREAQLYQSFNRKKLLCLPEVFYIKENDEEVILLMKKYRIIKHDEVNKEVLTKIMKAVAMVHQCMLPEFLLKSKSEVNILSNGEIMECVTGWKSVLNEHKGIFDDKPLDDIAMNINAAILWHASGESVLNHGDFHLNNLLLDEEENIVICDWQSVSNGNVSNDLGFFLSRLHGEGIEINEINIIDLYVQAVKELNGRIMDSEKIYRHMCASTLITSFLFWHQYLHGSSKERVKGIYDKMVQSMIKTIIRDE